MATTLNLCGWETGGTDEAETVSGTATSVQSTIKRTGTYALKALASASFGYHEFSTPAQGSGQSYYACFYLYIATAPGADAPIFWMGDTASTNRQGELRLTTGGVLQLWAADGGGTFAQLGSNSAALSTGQWYRVEVQSDWDTDGWWARLEGTDFVTNVTRTGSAQCDQVRLGLGVRGTNVASGELYFDDFRIANGGTSNVDWLGEQSIVYLLPNQASDADTNITLTGAADAQTALGPFPHDDATSFISGATTTSTCIVECPDMPAASAVRCVAPGARVRGATATATNYLVGISSGGTTADSGAVSLATASFVTHDDTAGSKRYPVLRDTDPNGSVAWTEAAVNAVKLRVRTTDGNPAMHATSAWLAVVYVPATVTIPPLPGWHAGLSQPLITRPEMIGY